MLVFLGGTCNNSLWREKLIPKLRVPYFNPAVKDWTEECQEEEIKQREKSDFGVYVITPLMIGVYSIADIIDDVHKKPGKVIFCFLTTDNGKVFSIAQIKSLVAVGNMVQNSGSMYKDNLDQIADFLNQEIKENQ